MKKYTCKGWINGSDFDTNKPSNFTIEIYAANESAAEDLFDKKCKKGEMDVCEVILCYI